MWGIIPAAGAGSRIQPIAFSKELLPVGSQSHEGRERPRAVSEYLVERMICGGADKLCFVIAPGKTDILGYYGSRKWDAHIAYVVQPFPAGLCDALFSPAALISPDEQVLIGLPDTIWTPVTAFQELATDTFSFLLFPVEHPELFDAVQTDSAGNVLEIQVKQPDAKTHWIWGAMSMPGYIYHELHALWQRPERRDEYLGTLVNAWLSEGGRALGVRAGGEYIDVGTLDGYRHAMHMLDGKARSDNRDLILTEARA